MTCETVSRTELPGNSGTQPVNPEAQRPEAPAVITTTDLVKEYRRGAERIRALDGVSLEVAQGEFLAIVGPSGSGKTTLLQLLGCMDVPTSGEVTIAGRATSRLREGELTRLRREEIGFVFQHFGLLPALPDAASRSSMGAWLRGTPVNRSWRQDYEYTSRFHPDRAAGRDRHYCDSGFDPLPGLCPRPRVGAPHFLHLEHAPARVGDDA